MLIYAAEIAGAKDAQVDRVFVSNICGPIPNLQFKADTVTVENTSGHVIYFRPRCNLCHVGLIDGIPVQPGQERTLVWDHTHALTRKHGCQEWGGVRVWGTPGRAFTATILGVGHFHEFATPPVLD